MKDKMKDRNKKEITYGNKPWAKAVFTVEAAVIVPLSVTMIALLIGYCFYVHQSSWLTGAAYESLLKSMETGKGEEKDVTAQERMSGRIQEMPIVIGEITTKAVNGIRVRLSWQGKIQEEVFGERFGFGGEVALTAFDPVLVKRTQFLLQSMKDE